MQRRSKTQEPVDKRQEFIRTARRVYVKDADVEKHGYFPGCKKCDPEPQYSPNQTFALHSAKHRLRIMEALANTPLGHARLKMALGRIDHSLAEIVQRGNKRRLPGGELHDHCAPA